MALLNEAQRSQMRSNRDRREDDPTFDPFPVVKLHTLDAGAVWLLTDLLADGDIAFGLCDAGIGCPELRTVSLAEVEAMQGPRGIHVVPDPGFVPDRSLSAYLADALRDGSVND